MKIVKQDKKEGIVTLVPETLDDLWHLSHIVEGCILKRTLITHIYLN